jgi:hypothetical protein
MIKTPKKGKTRQIMKNALVGELHNSLLKKKKNCQQQNMHIKKQALAMS